MEPVSSVFTLTPAGESDLGELSALINSAYRGESSRKGWTTEADLFDDLRTDESQLARELAKPGHVILCLRRGEKAILGCVLLKRQSPSEAYLGILTIQPTLQAGGMGRTPGLPSKRQDRVLSWADRVSL